MASAAAPFQGSPGSALGHPPPLPLPGPQVWRPSGSLLILEASADQPWVRGHLPPLGGRGERHGAEPRAPENVCVLVCTPESSTGWRSSAGRTVWWGVSSCRGCRVWLSGLCTAQLQGRHPTVARGGACICVRTAVGCAEGGRLCSVCASGLHGSRGPCVRPDSAEGLGRVVCVRGAGQVSGAGGRWSGCGQERPGWVHAGPSRGSQSPSYLCALVGAGL